SRRRHTRFDCDWSSDVCSSDLAEIQAFLKIVRKLPGQAPPAFQPLSEVDLTTDRAAADMVARWQREFRSSYSPDVQAKLWKRDRSEERRVGKECRSRWATYE